jgi:hypothetical protein
LEYLGNSHQDSHLVDIYITKLLSSPLMNNKEIYDSLSTAQ